MLKKRNLISGFLKDKVSTDNNKYDNTYAIGNFPPKSETSKLNNIDQSCEKIDRDIISEILNTLKTDQEFIQSIYTLLRKELIHCCKEEIERVVLKEYKEQFLQKNCELEILNSQIKERGESYLEVKSQFQKFLSSTMNNLNNSIKLLQKKSESSNGLD